MSVNTKMTALADEIRTLNGSSDKLGIDAMTTATNSANTEISSQTDLISQIITALDGKTSGSGGVTLPTLSNEGSAEDLMLNK